MILTRSRLNPLFSLAFLFVASLAPPVSAQNAAAAPTALGVLPLPPAMIRLSIPDVRAFDAALGGGFKKALYGTLAEDDGVALGFGQSQVGAKLQDQWTRFRGETALSFKTIMDLQASSAALAVLNIGHMEMVLALETPLASLPDIFEAGTARIDHGKTYHLVRTGAADEGASGETRMGLAWSRDSGLLIITSSERAMKLALAAVAAGEKFKPKLDGLVSLELDLDTLQGDLYFKREFLFNSLPTAGETRGKISAALRMDAGRLVEVREGALPATSQRGATFDAPDAAASGWINDASDLLAEFRRGVLEPLPSPSLFPQLGSAPLPASKAATAEDRYATNIEVAKVANGAYLNDAAELDAWRTLFSSQPVAGFGYLVTRSKARLLAIPWPKDREADFAALLDATLTRRGARLAPATPGAEVRQYLMGPGLPVLAFKRAGEFLWIAQFAADLRSPPAISWSKDLVRFSKVNLASMRDEGKRWTRVEGPRSPETARPLSDRILGLLGWMPAVRTFEVERRLTTRGFRERVVFGVAPPSARPAASPAPPAAK